MPREWMDEMKGQRHVPTRGEVAHGERAERIQDANPHGGSRPPKFPAEDPEPPDQIPFLRFGITFVLAIAATAFTLYHGKFKTTAKPKLRPVSAFGVVEGNVSMVYEYLSTADYRTEWHMAAVEISGPAIDHSAIPGEIFAEELQVGNKQVLVQWTVLERQFPSTPEAQTAQFVLEGVADVGGKFKESWKQTFKLKGGLHHFAKTPQVNVEMELLLLEDDGKPLDKKQKRWRKLLLAGLKESLAMLRMRVDDLLALRKKTEEKKKQR